MKVAVLDGAFADKLGAELTAALIATLNGATVVETP